MTTIFLFLAFFLLFHMNRSHGYCSRTFMCKGLNEIKFPFFSTQMPSNCGLFMINCTAKIPQIQLKKGGKWYEIESISQGNNLIITDLELQQALNSMNCSDLSSFALPDSPWLQLSTVYKCNHTVNKSFSYDNCGKNKLYYLLEEDNSGKFPFGCSSIKIPKSWVPSKSHGSMIDSKFFVNITIPGLCYRCHYRGGTCSIESNGKFKCIGGKKGGRNEKEMKLGIGIGSSFVLIIVVAAVILIIRRRRNGSDLISKSNSSKSDIETSHVYFRIPVFSYKELEEATNNFSGDRLLGDGGFGTVYYGKLQDGREVAVKRLYDHNFKRVQQFVNEIEILTRLHHKNLVSLYGCTSRRSRELLLVYEFVPNGTVADHLHGDLSNPGSLPWPIRMSIAIETASALAYLHASDIIHRDVKTTNILLDGNFNVKVADFGLSRLIPNDVTHVSTAPQGTPGYVDPEYHQCYHLTDKSDVYSFGVVLVELISSKPAVDINRRKTEINLSNFAVKKIQNHAYDELIDHNLGYKTDSKVKKMITMVAELAFQCLQQEKAMRPTMDEVLQELRRIQNEENGDINEEIKEINPPLSSPDWIEASLLKNIQYPPSPISVTEKWISKSSNTSG